MTWPLIGSCPLARPLIGHRKYLTVFASECFTDCNMLSHSAPGSPLSRWHQGKLTSDIAPLTKSGVTLLPWKNQIQARKCSVHQWKEFKRETVRRPRQTFAQSVGCRRWDSPHENKIAIIYSEHSSKFVTRLPAVSAARQTIFTAHCCYNWGLLYTHRSCVHLLSIIFW